MSRRHELLGIVEFGNRPQQTAHFAARVGAPGEVCKAVNGCYVQEGPPSREIPRASRVVCQRIKSGFATQLFVID